MTQKYLEFETNLEVAACEEWLGREYGRDYHESINQAVVYPVPPDTWVGPPTEPPPEAFTWYYVRAVMKPGSGGVIVLDDEILRFATQQQTLSNGQLYSLDVSAEAVEFNELSPAGQAVING